MEKLNLEWAENVAEFATPGTVRTTLRKAIEELRIALEDIVKVKSDLAEAKEMLRAALKKCPSCGGKGWIPIFRKKYTALCVTCSGTGE